MKFNTALVNRNLFLQNHQKVKNLQGNFNLLSDLLNGQKPCVKVIFQDSETGGSEGYILGFL